MQPDIILLEKEWPDLNDTEKQLLAALVSNEAEFRLLKKALLVSKAAKEEVPVLSPRIKIALTGELAPQIPVRKMQVPFWLKMAAAVFVLALAGFVYWKITNTHQTEKNNSISASPVPVAPVNSLPVEKETTPTIPPTLATTPEPLVVQNKKSTSTTKRNNTTSLPKHNTTTVKNTMEPAIPTLVQNDPHLLENITEVY